VRNAINKHFNELTADFRKQQLEKLYCRGKYLSWEQFGRDYSSLFVMMKLGLGNNNSFYLFIFVAKIYSLIIIFM
jgi:hypothetical protein